MWSTRSTASRSPMRQRSGVGATQTPNPQQQRQQESFEQPFNPVAYTLQQILLEHDTFARKMANRIHIQSSSSSPSLLANPPQQQPRSSSVALVHDGLQSYQSNHETNCRNELQQNPAALHGATSSMRAQEQPFHSSSVVTPMQPSALQEHLHLQQQPPHQLLNFREYVELHVAPLGNRPQRLLLL